MMKPPFRNRCGVVVIRRFGRPNTVGQRFGRGGTDRTGTRAPPETGEFYGGPRFVATAIVGAAPPRPPPGVPCGRPIGAALASRESAECH